MMDKGSENFVSAFAFGYFCLRENKMLFLQYGNDEDEEIFLRLAFMQSLGGAGCCTIFFSCDGQSNRPDEPSTGGRGFRVSCFDRYCACGDRYGRCVRVTPRTARYFSFRVTAAGYVPQETPDYIVSAVTPEVNVELEEDIKSLHTLTVRPKSYGKTAEAPVSVQVIGLREIEKSPGANRDISRIVRGYPGVAFSPVGYRNDLIVRGGGPSENRFYMDGIEIPNINHFATQGATGGPVSIVNADLVREIKFYTGSFPADRAGAMSSVLDFRLREGSSERQTFKATLGASEAALSGSGHIGEKTTYLFSLRQSHLQLLFK